MFSHVGKQIKFFAIALFLLEGLASIIAGIVLSLSDNSEKGKRLKNF